MSCYRFIRSVISGGGLLLALVSCNGLFDGVYDELPAVAGPDEQPVQHEDTIKGTLYIDASSWTKWHYLNLHALKEATDDGQKAEVTVQTFDIPTAETEAFDAEATGIYTYWYDVFGEGISKREFRSSYPTASQPEPSRWDLAFHRNNVRTNDGAVIETSCTEISQVGDHDQFSTQSFVGDTWNETDVWTVQSRMLQGLVGNQRIKVNSELSKWLKLDIPPMPPSFTYNGHVFIVRFSDGTYAALRLKNYVNSANVKCHLTIEYVYPL